LEFVDEAPSAAPSASPSGVPSESSVPSLKPSLRPSVSSAPSFIPSVSPTLSVAPSASPTQKPTPMPTKDRTIMGSVLEDTDNDDIGDSPIKGVTLVLYDTVTAQPIASTTTSDSGAFAFTGLVPGKYSVVEENLKGFLDVTDSNGGNPNIIEIDLGLSDVKDIFFVDERPSLAPSVSSSPSGTPSLAPSISAIPSAQPSGGVVLGGTVWEDVDNDNKGDEPIPSVVIALWNSDTKTIISTTLTDDSGKFMFTEMKAGNYVLNEITPKGFHDVTDWDQGNPNTISIKMAPGDIRMDLYFVDERPSAAPSERPSAQPTIQPTPDPTGLPTVSPTKKPTGRPTPRPTNKPTQPPTRKPTLHPTKAPAWSAPHFTPVYLPPTAKNNPECICIYFDEMTLSRGDFVRDQYLEHYGFEITADGGYSPENNPNSARIFDTLHIDDDGEESDDFLSKHWDQKNVLIIQDIYKEDPADNDSGGVIEIHFKEEVVYMDSVSMLDADFALDEVKLIFKDGSSESFFYADTGNGDYHTVEIQRKDVRKVQIKLAGSGAVADFTYCPNNFEGNLKNLE